MSEAELVELERLCGEIVPGPWEWELDGGLHWACCLVGRDVRGPGRVERHIVLQTQLTGRKDYFEEVTAHIVGGNYPYCNDVEMRAEGIAILEFIAAARTAVPALIAEVRRLRAATQRGRT